ncbi:hypothetical protein Peur_021347 [Populus x canadensis]
MAKNKRKATSIVARRQDALPAPIVGPKDHDPGGDDSEPRDVGLSALHPASVMVVASSSKSLDAVLMEDCSVASDDEILDEDQLDFNFSDEECDDSPQAPTLLPTKNLPSPPSLLPAEQIPSPPLTKSVMPSSPTSCFRELAPFSVAGNPLSAPNSSQCILGKPIQCDQLTSTLSRMSYARVLVEIVLLEELRHSVEISLPEGLTLHQKVVYETLPKYCNFYHVLSYTYLLCLKAAAATIKIVQDHSQDHDIPVVSRGDTGSEADHVITNGWVTVHSRQKSSRQYKGKAVAVSKLVFVDNSPATPSPPACTGIVQNSPRIDTLVATPCAGEVRGSSPS